MTAILIAIAASLVAAASIKYALTQRKRRIEADGLLHAYMEGDKLRQQLAKKTEEVQHVQAKDKAKVDTGNPAADFAGSLDVLSNSAARRRKG